jgi:hypothetical protein
LLILLPVRTLMMSLTKLDSKYGYAWAHGAVSLEIHGVESKKTEEQIAHFVDRIGRSPDGRQIDRIGQLQRANVTVRMKSLHGQEFSEARHDRRLRKDDLQIIDAHQRQTVSVESIVHTLFECPISACDARTERSAGTDDYLIALIRMGSR